MHSPRTPRWIGAAALLLSIFASRASARQVDPRHPLARHYVAGDSIAYEMRASNIDRTDTLRYAATAVGTVLSDSAGHFVERLRWTRLVRNGTPITPKEPGDRQTLSLDADWQTPPNLRVADPQLVGPMLDLFTFYVDLKLASLQPTLTHPGDHALLSLGVGGSWADGAAILVAEDAIDFDITLTGVDRTRQEAEVLVRHVPPVAPKIHLAAAWMATPVSDGANNWVEVLKTTDGRFRGLVGRETFAVTLRVSLVDGRILNASMDNPVDVVERTCTDRALTACSEPIRYRIRRTIELTTAR